MEKELSKQDKGFIKDLVETGNGTQAVLDNYDVRSKQYASLKAHLLMKKPKIQEAIQSLAERIPDDLLEKVHLEGLEAGKTIFKNNNTSGEIEEVGYEPDYAVRHKYLDSAYKLKGVYAPEKSINLNVQAEITNPKARQLAEAYEEELKKNL